MADVTTINIAEVRFGEAVRLLRAMAAMTDDQFHALEAGAARQAFSFAGAYRDSMAKAVQDILADVAAGNLSRDQFQEKANAALERYNFGLDAPQSNNILETTLSRVFNDAAKSQVLQSKTISSAYPYFGIDTAMDSRVRPNHFALDWRRIRTVFPITDMLMSRWPLPAGFRCRCSRRFFSQDTVDQMDLAVGRGEEWYGRIESVTVPGQIPKAVAILPDDGFGLGGLTGKQRLAAAIVAIALRGVARRAA